MAQVARLLAGRDIQNASKIHYHEYGSASQLTKEDKVT